MSKWEIILHKITGATILLVPWGNGEDSSNGPISFTKEKPSNRSVCLRLHKSIWFMVYISCNVLKISLPIESIHFSGENCGYAELPIDEESLSQLLESDEARQYLSTEGLLDMLPSDAQQTGQLCRTVALAAIVVFFLFWCHSFAFLPSIR